MNERICLHDNRKKNKDRIDKEMHGNAQYSFSVKDRSVRMSSERLFSPPKKRRWQNRTMSHFFCIVLLFATLLIPFCAFVGS